MTELDEHGLPQCNCPVSAGMIGNHSEWCNVVFPSAAPAQDIVTAQHDETGRMWTGERSALPPRYSIVIAAPAQDVACDHTFALHISGQLRMPVVCGKCQSIVTAAPPPAGPKFGGYDSIGRGKDCLPASAPTTGANGLRVEWGGVTADFFRPTNPPVLPDTATPAQIVQALRAIGLVQ